MESMSWVFKCTKGYECIKGERGQILKLRGRVGEMVSMLSMFMKRRSIDLKGVGWEIGSIKGQVVGLVEYVHKRGTIHLIYRNFKCSNGVNATIGEVNVLEYGN